MDKMTPELLNEKPLIQLYCGDCLEIMPTIKDKSVDLVLTDLPYAGAGMRYHSFDDTNINEVNELTLKFLEQAKRIAKITIFPSGKYDTEKMLFKISPPQWRLCWHKGAGSNISAVGFNDWEMMMVYGDKICVNQHDHFTISNTEKLGNYGHPCPKPIRWATWIISRFSPKSGIVCDPFSGSGTVGIATKELNRNCILIEKEPKYCDIIRRRINNAITELF